LTKFVNHPYTYVAPRIWEGRKEDAVH
jgi:hypothetical protein